MHGSPGETLPCHPADEVAGSSRLFPPPRDAASTPPAHRCRSRAAPWAWLDTGREPSCLQRRELTPHRAALRAGSLAPRRKKFARFSFAGKPGPLARLPGTPSPPATAPCSRDLEPLALASRFSAFTYLDPESQAYGACQLRPRTSPAVPPAPQTVVAQIVPFLFKDGSELFGGVQDLFTRWILFEHPLKPVPYGKKTIMKVDVRMSEKKNCQARSLDPAQLQFTCFS